MPLHTIVWRRRNLYPSIHANATVTLVSGKTTSQEEISEPRIETRAAQCEYVCDQG
jgi:hypothetical protein